MIISQMVRSKKHRCKGSWPLITANTKHLPGSHDPYSHLAGWRNYQERKGHHERLVHYRD